MRRLLYLLSLLLAVSLVFPVLASPAAQTFNCSTVTEIPVTECQALIALYTSTNSPGWTDHTGWATTTTPCSWYGVTCIDGHVAVLNLSSNQLSGSIPPQLGSLTSLQNLSLNNNQLSGNIPPQLGSLAKLQYLYLNNNQLSGNIPPQLGNLAGITVIDLSNNQLNGSIPPQLGNITMLLILWLHNNQLSGSIPAEFGNLASLWRLDLHNNQLSGSIPPQLGSLTFLQYLYLNNNQLSGDIPATLTNLTQLIGTYTDLGYNRLTASDPTLLAFLATKDSDWATTQTIPPANVRLTGSMLTWTPIVYTGDGGYYIIGYLNPASWSYTVVGQTVDKTATSYTLSGLSNSTTYYFTVQSYTPAHGEQQNNLTSRYSQMRDAILSAANAVPKPVYYEVNPPTLTWNAISWAAGYEIQVATDKTFPPAAMIYTKADLPASALSVSAAVPQNGMYYWRVRAIRVDKSAGAWSAVDSFVVDVAP